MQEIVTIVFDRQDLGTFMARHKRARTSEVDIRAIFDQLTDAIASEKYYPPRH
jgi:hypothetical protein